MKHIDENSLFLIVSGHGGEAVYDGICSTFDSVRIYTDDPNIILKIRKNDLLISNINNVEQGVGFMAGYKDKINDRLLSQNKIYNVHYSILPRWRGLHSVAWALLNGDSQIGWTIHQVNEGFDSGDILYQQKYNYEGETSRELMDKFDNDVKSKISNITKMILSHQIAPQQQNEEFATWGVRRNLDDCLIDFNSTAVFIERLLKTLVSPYPLPRIRCNGVIYEIHNANVIKKDYVCTNGRVLNIDNHGAYIKITGGILVIGNLSDEYGNFFSAKDILKLGARLS